MALTENYVSESQVTSTGYVMIAVATVFFASRFGLRFWKSVGVQWEDLFVVSSWMSFLALSVLYIVVTPALYRVTGATSGTFLQYPTMTEDALFMKKVFFANTLLLWISLWSVKLSLLILYRRLLSRLKNEMRWWRGALVFTILSFLGCVISNFTSCDNMSAWFSLGGCLSPREVTAQITSLYYSYAVDVITDIMVMVLPMKLLWSLKLPIAQKLSVAAIFCTGVICIIMATVRVVLIGSKANNDSTPSSSWLAFWATLEAGIAVIIGCLPAFAIIYRRERNTRRPYGSGYASMGPHPHHNRIPLPRISACAPKPPMRAFRSTPSPTISKPNGIKVTHSVEMNEEFLAHRWG